MKQTMGAILLAGILAASASGDTQPWDVEQSFNTGSGKTLTIDLRSGGDIRIAGTGGDKVNVKARREGRDRDDIDVQVNQTSSGVEVTSRYLGERRSYNAGADVEIEVPASFNVDLETTGGDVEIRNVEGNFEGETMGGDFDLQNLKGVVRLTTMGGDIQVSDSNLDGEVRTMGGDVVLRDVTGSLDGSTMGGDVVQEGKKSPSPGKTGTGHEKRVSSMGGDLKVDTAPYGATLETMGGDIQVRSVADHIRAKTMGGDISVDAVDGWADLTTMGGDITMIMVGDASKGERNVEATSMGGDIEITLPDNLSASFDLEIEYEERGTRAPKIISDFPIQITESDDCRHDHDRSCRVIHGKGTNGSGTNRVKIRTFDGDIIIKKG